MGPAEIRLFRSVGPRSEADGVWAADGEDGEDVTADGAPACGAKTLAGDRVAAPKTIMLGSLMSAGRFGGGAAGAATIGAK